MERKEQWALRMTLQRVTAGWDNEPSPEILCGYTLLGAPSFRDALRQAAEIAPAMEAGVGTEMLRRTHR